MAAKLIISKQGQELNDFPLDKTIITLGRKHINDLHLDDPGVSGAHAKILTVGNDSFIEDLNSTNGTYLNDERVSKSPLRDQDVLIIGQFTLRFSNDTAQNDDDMEKTMIIQPNAAITQASEPPAQVNTPKPPIDSSASQAMPASGIGIATLTGIDGVNKGKSVTLSGIITRIKGSKGQSSVISKKDDGYYLLNTLLEDVAPSINGATVPVGSTKLNDGDIISIGNNQFRLGLL